MEDSDSLKEIERRAYRSTFEDGFYEITCSLLFLLFAWIPILEAFGIPGFYCYPVILIPAMILWLGKRYVTIPRLGAVEFGEKRKAIRRYTALIGLGAIILMLPLVIMMFAKGIPGGLTWQMVAIIAAPAIVIGALLMNYARMYVYAALFFFSILASEFLLSYINKLLGSLLVFGLPGIAIAGYGIFLLVKFLKAYPKPAEEASGVR